MSVVKSWLAFRDEGRTEHARRQDSHSPEGLRRARARPEHGRDRRDRETYRRAAGGTDSAADRDQQVDGAPFAARGQEVARAVRSPHAQAADRSLRADTAAGGRADEGGFAGGGG